MPRGRVMFALRQRAQQPANTPGHGSGVSPNAGIGGGLLLRYGLVDPRYHRQTLIRVIDSRGFNCSTITSNRLSRRVLASCGSPVERPVFDDGSPKCAAGPVCAVAGRLPAKSRMIRALPASGVGVRSGSSNAAKRRSLFARAQVGVENPVSVEERFIAAGIRTHPFDAG